MLSTRSGDYVEGPRHAVVTPDDNGAVLQIVTYFLIVVAVLATLLRLFLRVNVAHAAGIDDGLACLAMVSKLLPQMDCSVANILHHSCLPSAKSSQHRAESNMDLVRK